MAPVSSVARHVRLAEVPETSDGEVQTPKLPFRQSKRFILGATVVILGVAGVAAWTAQCKLGAGSGSEQDLLSLAEVPPMESTTWDARGKDKDALIKWLVASNSAGQAAENAPAGEGLAADASQAIQEAMSTNDPAKARKIAKRVMRRTLAKTRKARRDLGAFVKGQRRSLGKGKGKNEMEKANTAECVFNVLTATNSIAHIATDLNDAMKTCSDFKMKGGIMKFLKNGTRHHKVCAVNVAFAFSEFANLAASLSIAADTCASTLVPNVDALCSGAVNGMVYATSGLGGSAILMASACNGKWLDTELQPGIVPHNTGSNELSDATDRRLDARVVDVSASEPAPVRKLMFGGGKGSTATQCFFDATSAMWALAQASLAINAAATGTCPPKNMAGGSKVKGPMYKTSEAFCTSDVGGILTAFLLAIYYLQMMVVQCTDELNLKAICGAGVDMLMASLATFVQAGAGANLACDEFQKPAMKKLLNMASKLDAKTGGKLSDMMGGMGSLGQSGNYGRRLEADGGEDFDDDIKELQRRFKTPEEAFKSIGYDLEDKEAPWRAADARHRPGLSDLTKLVEEKEDDAGLFGSSATCRAE